MHFKKQQKCRRHSGFTSPDGEDVSVRVRSAMVCVIGNRGLCALWPDGCQLTRSVPCLHRNRVQLIGYSALLRPEKYQNN